MRTNNDSPTVIDVYASTAAEFFKRVNALVKYYSARTYVAASAVAELGYTRVELKY